MAKSFIKGKSIGGAKQLGIFDSMKSNGKSSSDEMRPSPVREFLGQELFAIDCRGSNL